VLSMDNTEVGVGTKGPLASAVLVRVLRAASKLAAADPGHDVHTVLDVLSEDRGFHLDREARTQVARALAEFLLGFSAGAMPDPAASVTVWRDRNGGREFAWALERTAEVVERQAQVTASDGRAL
jgi:hypothetical protein